MRGRSSVAGVQFSGGVQRAGPCFPASVQKLFGLSKLLVHEFCRVAPRTFSPTRKCACWRASLAVKTVELKYVEVCCKKGTCRTLRLMFGPLQRGEREELAPGSTYHAAKLGDEHVIVRGLTRRTHLGGASYR